MFKFTYANFAKGDFSEAKEIIQKSISSKDTSNFFSAIDALAYNDDWRESFQTAFSKEFGKEVKFSKLTEEQIQKQVQNFDTTQSSIAPVIATTVLPTMEALVRSNELLSLINIQTVARANYLQIWEFATEQDAAILSEVAAGSDVDEVLRTDDKLIPNQKVQASMKLSEFAINTMDSNTFGKYMARLVRRVQQKLCVAILSNGNGVANGTARGDNMRGILNNYGVNGTGDATGAIGAISYASKSATDTAITTAGGVASVDTYDLCVKVKALLLPSNIADVEEDEYVYLMNRNSWGAIRTVLDSNGRYKARSAFDPATGKVVREIDGTRVLIVPSNQCPNSRVYLFPPKFYTLVMDGSILQLQDNGIVQLREGLYSFVTRAWVNGSMEYGQKFLPTTAATIGTTTPDNNESNAFRVFNLV